ncbi:hypothetical protein EIP86_007727 [Pleurotus ostreatoroseus]|nr:hypothetical protein EIP86_007727 [Pleurotus ostreatoroseus]
MFVTPGGSIFIGLNVLRILSIISMILVLASSIFVMVTDIQAVNNFMKDSNDTDLTDCDYIEGSTVPNQPAGVFWAVVNRLLIIFQVIVLILSEFGWPSKFFDRFFPVLGTNFGLGPLGIFQCLIGATILSHHVDDFTLVAGFFLFAIGCVNMLCGLIFRAGAKDRRRLSWKNGAGTVLPTSQVQKVQDLRPQFSRPRSGYLDTVFGRNKEAEAEAGMPEKRGEGFGLNGQRKSGLKGFMLSRPVEALSKYSAGTPRPANPNSRAGTPEPLFKSSKTAL